VISKRLVGALIMSATGFLAVLITAGSASITWDEAIYMRTARRYMTWVDIVRRNPAEAFNEATMTEYWQPAVPQPSGAGRVEDIHPPLIKFVAGLLWRMSRGLVGDLVGFRLASAILFGLAVGTLFLWLSEVYSVSAGLAAALFLGVMPRYFAYSHLLALDAPLAVLSLITTYVYWKTTDRPGLHWSIPFGLAWGLALASKNGGWLLPLGLVGWTLLYYRTWMHGLRLILSALVAVSVFVVSWPWLYQDTIGRLSEFASFAFLGHAGLLNQYTYYLGQIYQQTPWHYPLVMSAAVLPSTVLLVLVVGVATVIGDGQTARTGWLLTLSALGPMLPFLLGLVAAYDGERLFLSSFPFLAALGGIGLARSSDTLWNWLWRHRPQLVAHRDSSTVRAALTGIVALIIAIPPVGSIVHLHPYELAYYSELVGGIQGAVRLGLETTFWADGYQGVLDYVNQNAGANATVWADAYQVLWAYQDIGRLRKDIFVPGADMPEPTGADLAVVQTRQSRYFPAVARLMQSRSPDMVVQRDGVPLVMVYRVR